MSATLVIQSHRDPLPFDWLQACLDSVAAWARANEYDYRFIDDRLFDLLAPDLREKNCQQRVIASDLARLRCLQQGLAEGYDCVIWCDADFLIFKPRDFILLEANFALGREVWVQHDVRGKLRTYIKVHNAFLMFRRGNHFLDFYADSAERLLRLNQGRVAPQFIGPKLLTALHNIVQCPVMESAGMLSPLVLRDLVSCQNDALRLMQQQSSVKLAGANLGSSLTLREGIGDEEMEAIIEHLVTKGL
ncbi:MAG: hypothetical protein GY896_12160 [Gammaproteobacteria bacterium]|nr:hypothetical protein [Gammaproteobacteria bacterium]